MKKLTGLLLIAVLFVFPFSTHAEIIGNVNLEVINLAPAGQAKFPAYQYGSTYSLNYQVKINGGPAQAAFCVEQYGGPTGITYTLLANNATLADFGLNASRFLAAGAIAEYWLNNYAGSDAYKAGAQLAIWDIIYDGTFNLSAGNFTSSSGYAAQAQTIMDHVNLNISSSPWVLAVNPTVRENQQVVEGESQNFLVRVPEPMTMLLFGLGLVGLAGLRRKV